MRPLLEALNDGGEHSVREAHTAAADRLQVDSCRSPD